MPATPRLLCEQSRGLCVQAIGHSPHRIYLPCLPTPCDPSVLRGEASSSTGTCHSNGLSTCKCQAYNLQITKRNNESCLSLFKHRGSVQGTGLFIVSVT